MCRMMVMRSKNNMKDIERHAHKVWQWQNRDGVGIYTDTTGLRRYPLTAEYIPLKEYYRLMIYHARLGTGGKGTHPFISEDGRYYLIHNGWLINHQPLKEELIKRGHVFRTKIDSEILLHLFEECKKSKKHPIKTLIKRLALWDVNGKLNFIVWDSKSDKFYVYSDGDLEYIYTPDWLIWIATEFNTWASREMVEIVKPLVDGTYLVTKKLRIIENGRVENGNIGVKHLTGKPTKATIKNDGKNPNLTITHFNLTWGRQPTRNVKVEKRWRGKP